MEQNNPTHNETFKSILEKIQKNEIKIKPKTYHRLKLGVLVCVISALIIVSIFLTSLIVFTLRASGHAALFGFGLTGLQVFLLLFPWKLLCLGIVLILILEWLLRSFRFGYKIPVLYLLLSVTVFMAGVGIIIDRFRLHDELMVLAGDDRFSMTFTRVYDQARRPPPPPIGHGILRGVIVFIGTSTLDVEIENSLNASTTLVRVTFPLLLDFDDLIAGDHIFIRGEMDEGHIEAEDLRKAIVRSFR